MTGLISFLIGITPIIWLFLGLCVLRLPGHIVCPLGLALAAALAFSGMGAPASEITTAAFEGALFALWPILLAVVAAMILYKYSVETGGMDKIKALLTGVSRDKRILVLILAWGFGGFLEGIAGFGVPVMIPGCILVSLGFSPMFSVVACLVANSAPTPYATIGIPVTTLSGVTGIDAGLLGFNVAVQLFVPCLIIPFFLVMLTGGGFRAIRGVGLIALISGLSFAIPLLLVSRFIGPELPTLLGSVCAIACTAAAAKRFYRDEDAYNRKFQLDQAPPDTLTPEARSAPPVTAAQAALPFGIVLVLVTATSLIGPVHEALSKIRLDAVVFSGEGGYTLSFVFLLTPGVLILVSVLLSCFLQGRKLKEFVIIAKNTVFESRKTIATVVSIVAMAKIMDYSGMTDAIALMLIAAFGAAYPLIAPVIGMLGTFITGSDTTCCILFGSLQAGAARAIGANPAWIASANLSAAAAGKMISPQSVAVGLRIGGLDGREGEIIRQTLKYALVCTAVICVASYGGAQGF